MSNQIKNTAAVLALLSAGTAPAELVKLLRSSRCPAIRQAEQHEEAAAQLHTSLRQIEEWLDQGIRTAAFGTADYPWKLERLPSPPPLLWLKGSQTPELTVAVVGTRTPSRCGLTAASQAAKTAVLNGFGIISGLARGIDAAAHGAALQQGGWTGAVLAHGLDRIHPTEHTSLAERILDAGGTLYSIWPPGTPPMRWRFPARNRIQAGLSCGSIIGETGPRGGTVYHAETTATLKRPLGILPPEQGNKEFGEGVRLLRQKMPGTLLQDPPALLAFLNSCAEVSPVPSQCDPFLPFP